MTQPVDYYVDPSIAAASGAGTIGDPYGDIQHALDTITRDATHGDQINIKAGTAEILAAALTLATYGTPSASAPLILRGYTSAANDGGRGAIDANSFSLFASTGYTNVMIIDLDCSNFGSSQPVHFGNGGTVVNCKIHGSTYAGYGVDVSTYGAVLGCYIYDLGSDGDGINLWEGSHAIGNYVKIASGGANIGINAGRFHSYVGHNVINLANTGAHGILVGNVGNTIVNNSIYNSTAGTFYGIQCDGNRYNCLILNNIVEGFSGTGGRGINTGSTMHLGVVQGNRAYNCSTNFSIPAVAVDDDNSALSASAFTDPSTDDFTIGTEAKGAAWPTYIGGDSITSTPHFMDTGAAQREEPAGGGGGGGTKLAGFGGGMVG